MSVGNALEQDEGIGEKDGRCNPPVRGVASIAGDEQPDQCEKAKVEDLEC